jgi:DNA-binding NarL/FixJ family response regulator
MPSAPPDARAVRILIADDHRLFAESLMAALSEDERVDVVGIAENGQQAVDLAAQLQPDVILMDLKMPVLDGFEATRRIREAGFDMQILVLTGTDEAIGSEDAVAAGASGFLRKEQSVAELKDVLLEVTTLAAVLGRSSSLSAYALLCLDWGV